MSSVVGQPQQSPNSTTTTTTNQSSTSNPPPQTTNIDIPTTSANINSSSGNNNIGTNNNSNDLLLSLLSSATNNSNHHHHHLQQQSMMLGNNNHNHTTNNNHNHTTNNNSPNIHHHHMYNNGMNHHQQPPPQLIHHHQQGLLLGGQQQPSPIEVNQQQQQQQMYMQMMMNQQPQTLPPTSMSHALISSLTPQQQQQLLLFYASQYDLPSQQVLFNLMNNQTSLSAAATISNSSGASGLLNNNIPTATTLINNNNTSYEFPSNHNNNSSTSTIDFGNLNTNNSPSSPPNHHQQQSNYILHNLPQSLANNNNSTAGIQTPTIFLTNNNNSNGFINTVGNNNTNILSQLHYQQQQQNVNNNIFMPGTFNFNSTHQTPFGQSINGQQVMTQSLNESNYQHQGFLYPSSPIADDSSTPSLNLDFHEFISTTPSTPRVDGILSISEDFETGTLTEHGIDMSMATSDDTVQTIIEQTLVGKGKRKFDAISESSDPLISSPHSNPSPLLSVPSGLSILTKLPTNQQRSIFKYVKDSLKDDGLEDIFNTADSTSGGSSEGFTGSSFFGSEESPSDFTLFNALNVKEGGNESLISMTHDMPQKKRLVSSPLDGLPLSSSPSPYQQSFRAMLQGNNSPPSTLISIEQTATPPTNYHRRDSGATQKPYIQNHSPSTTKRQPGVHRRKEQGFFQGLTAPPNSPMPSRSGSQNNSLPNSLPSSLPNSLPNSRPGSPTKEMQNHSTENMNEFMSQLQRSLMNQTNIANPFSVSTGQNVSQPMNSLNYSQMVMSSNSQGQMTFDDKRANERKHFLPSNATDVLRDWFLDHIEHPYPSSKEKQDLSELTGLTYVQVANWFTNTRKRNWQQMKKEAEKRKNGESSGNESTELNDNNQDFDLMLKEEIN